MTRFLKLWLIWRHFVWDWSLVSNGCRPVFHKLEICRWFFYNWNFPFQSIFIVSCSLGWAKLSCFLRVPLSYYKNKQAVLPMFCTYVPALWFAAVSNFGFIFIQWPSSNANMPVFSSAFACYTTGRNFYHNSYLKEQFEPW